MPRILSVFHPPACSGQTLGVNLDFSLCLTRPHLICGSCLVVYLESDHFSPPPRLQPPSPTYIMAVASAWVSLLLPFSTQWPEDPVITYEGLLCPSLFRTLRGRTQVLPVADKAITSLTLSPISFPLTHSAPAILASLLILKFARYTPTSGPLHILPLLPEAFSFQIAEWFALPLFYHLPQMLPSQGGLSWLIYLIFHRPLP